jgi:hypothetical protein
MPLHGTIRIDCFLAPAQLPKTILEIQVTALLQSDSGHIISIGRRAIPVAWIARAAHPPAAAHKAKIKVTKTRSDLRNIN